MLQASQKRKSINEKERNGWLKPISQSGLLLHQQVSFFLTEAVFGWGWG
jgi:hypothetical protein